MKEFNSIYLGIILQNNDPEKRGRVKVFVPHISTTVYNKWIEKNTDNSFRFVGSNVDKNLTPILEDLKIILPWAEISAPLTSENGSGRFNNHFNLGFVSDANFTENYVGTLSTNAPGEFYERSNNRLYDGFSGIDRNVNRPNPYSYMYKPNVYSNKAKGSFGIPSVGSHVYVFFRDGDPNFPVIMGASFGQSDWQGIYDSDLDYPSKFENDANDEVVDGADINVTNYRNKYVLNQKGGVFEIVNSDLNEKIKLTHYSGSFKEFNNDTNIELATKNDQKLVLNDQYSTVQGFKNEYIGKNYDEIILRDKFKKIGNLDSNYYTRWKNEIGPLQDNKQLFEIKRAVANNTFDDNGNILIKRNSLKQERSGDPESDNPGFRNYPVTDGTLKYTTLDGKDNTATGDLGGTYSNVANNSSNISMPNTNDNSATLKNPSNDQWVSLNNNDWGPGGVGKSVSSQEGNWEIDKRKEGLKDLIEERISKLLDVELELGLGGSEIVEIAKHKLETIGPVMNDYGSIRVDDIGKLTSSEVVINNNSVYVNKKGTPLIEYVHVQDLPGGNSTLNVANRYNVMVGAGGLNLKSYGPTNISGTITNVAGEQINLGSNNEINIDSKVINISAEILRLRNKRQRQVLIDSSLGVNKNVVIGGGLHVEGETHLQHVTAPREFQETEITRVFAKLLSGLSFNADIAGVGSGSGVSNKTITLVADSNDNKVQCYDHSHSFANLPLTLKDNSSDVRDDAEDLNNEDRKIATPRNNSKK